MSAVSIRNLTLRLGGRTILRDFNLDVEAGEFLVLLGPSGCGKSTALNAIAGLTDMDAGEIHIAGRDVTALAPADRQIAMVFQSYALYPGMNVERNLGFGMRVRGASAEAVATRVREVAQLLELDTLLQRKPAQLSGGQRQRVAIGRALVRQAPVILFDEPLSHLDAQLRVQLRHEIRALHLKLRPTIIYVTHDQAEAMSLADRIVVMRDGVIEQSGTAQAVYARPQSRFVAGFLGTPPMNFVRATLQAGHAGTSVRLCGADLVRADLPAMDTAAGPREVDIGFRPEDVVPAADGPLNATVRRVEPMGNHEIAWLDCSGVAIQAWQARAGAMRAGESLRFDVAPDALHVFDLIAGRRL